MATLTYHVEQISDTYANILTNMDEYQLGISTNTFGSVGQADDMVFQNDGGEHYTVARQFKIANDDTTISYCTNNFGTTYFHNHVSLKNDTAENTDEGRETKLSWIGLQSGSESSTLVTIEAHHDGSSDDQKGELEISINDGSDDDAPTSALKIDSSGYVQFSGLTETLQFKAVSKTGGGTISGTKGYITFDVGGVEYYGLIGTTMGV